MRVAAVCLSILLAAAPALSQRPADPALLLPQEAPGLDYVAIREPLRVPAGTTLGRSSAVAIDSKGHLLVLNRGPEPLMEFDRDGEFVRAFGRDLFARPHGLRVDAEDNIWVTDVRAHVVLKLSQAGEVLLTLGAQGQPGEWNEATGSFRFDEPNDVAIGATGELFVVQGHGRADPRVLKFDSHGNFVKSWGGRGTGRGQFAVAHSVAVDASGLVWVADRENQRIQVFDADGEFVREARYAGLPCGLHIGRAYVYMVNGFAGQLLRLDLNGNVLGAMGRVGEAVGEFGEAHFVAVGPNDEIYVADPVKGPVQKFVKR